MFNKSLKSAIYIYIKKRPLLFLCVARRKLISSNSKLVTFPLHLHRQITNCQSRSSFVYSMYNVSNAGETKIV